MSNSLLKRSLQIVEESLETNKAENAAKSKKKKTNGAQPRSSTFDLIPENQRLIKVSKVGKTQQKSKIFLYQNTNLIYKTTEKEYFNYFITFFSCRKNQRTQTAAKGDSKTGSE